MEEKKIEFYRDHLEDAERQEGRVQRDIRRGDVYWCPTVEVSPEGELYVGKTRPVVVVSNQKANTFSAYITYCPITSQEKKSLPTHVDIECNEISGTVLCEKIISVHVSKLGTFCGEVDSETQTKIDEALRVQLSLTNKSPNKGQPTNSPDTQIATCACTSSDVFILRHERDMYKQMYRELLDRLVGGVSNG